MTAPQMYQIGEPRPEAYPRAGWLDVLALPSLLLLWPVGVVLVWRSRIWSWKDRLIATLVPPGGASVGFAASWLPFQNVTVPCSSGTYAENGSLISPGNCPPEAVLAAAFTVASVLLSTVFVLWPVLAAASVVYLAWRMWWRTERPSQAAAVTGASWRSRPWLIVGLTMIPATGSLIVLLLGAGSLFSGFTVAHSQRPTDGAAPVPSPSVTIPGAWAFPNLTLSQLRRSLGDRGCSCREPEQLGDIWVTDCRAGSDTVVVFGTDGSSVDVVNATAAVGQGAQADDAGKLFDAVVQSASQPADVGEIDAWVHGHLSGGTTDIDGYRVSIVANLGFAILTIQRSRP